MCGELRKLSGEHNDRQPIAKLPPELLAQIFQRVELRQRVAVARTQRAWRDVLYTWPGIWSILDFNAQKFKSKDALRQLLQLSAGAPLSLELTIGDDYLEDVCSLLEVNLHRCVELRLILRGGQSISARVTSALGQPARRLRSLYLDDSFQLYNKEMDPSISLFSGQAPELRIFKALCNVRSLRWSANTFRPVRTVVFAPSSGFHVSDLIEIRDLFSSAEAITFRLRDWVDDDNDPGELVQFSSALKRLAIIAFNDAMHGRRMLNHIETSSIQSVWTLFDKYAIGTADGTLLDQLCDLSTGADMTPTPDVALSTHTFIARTMSFEFSPATRFPFNIFMYEEYFDRLQKVTRHETSPMRSEWPLCKERVALNIGNSATFNPFVFANLTRLYLTEIWVNTDSLPAPFPPLVSLRHLTIFVLKSESHLTSHVFSAFVSAQLRRNSSRLGRSERANDPTLLLAEEQLGPPEEGFNILQCPALEVLELVARPPAKLNTSLTRLTPGSIRDFAEMYLRYNRPVLQRLELTGLELEVGDPMEFELMLQLAEDVVFDERFVMARFASPTHLNWT